MGIMKALSQNLQSWLQLNPSCHFDVYGIGV